MYIVYICTAPVSSGSSAFPVCTAIRYESRRARCTRSLLAGCGLNKPIIWSVSRVIRHKAKRQLLALIWLCQHQGEYRIPYPLADMPVGG